MKDNIFTRIVQARHNLKVAQIEMTNAYNAFIKENCKLTYGEKVRLFSTITG